MLGDDQSTESSVTTQSGFDGSSSESFGAGSVCESTTRVQNVASGPVKGRKRSIGTPWRIVGIAALVLLCGAIVYILYPRSKKRHRKPPPNLVLRVLKIENFSGDARLKPAIERLPYALKRRLEQRHNRRLRLVFGEVVRNDICNSSPYLRVSRKGQVNSGWGLSHPLLRWPALVRRWRGKKQGCLKEGMRFRSESLKAPTVEVRLGKRASHKLSIGVELWSKKGGKGLDVRTTVTEAVEKINVDRQAASMADSSGGRRFHCRKTIPYTKLYSEGKQGVAVALGPIVDSVVWCVLGVVMRRSEWIRVSPLSEQLSKVQHDSIAAELVKGLYYYGKVILGERLWSDQYYEPLSRAIQAFDGASKGDGKDGDLGSFLAYHARITYRGTAASREIQGLLNPGMSSSDFANELETTSTDSMVRRWEALAFRNQPYSDAAWTRAVGVLVTRGAAPIIEPLLNDLRDRWKPATGGVLPKFGKWAITSIEATRDRAKGLLREAIQGHRMAIQSKQQGGALPRAVRRGLQRELATDYYELQRVTAMYVRRIAIGSFPLLEVQRYEQEVLGTRQSGAPRGRWSWLSPTLARYVGAIDKEKRGCGRSKATTAASCEPLRNAAREMLTQIHGIAIDKQLDLYCELANLTIGGCTAQLAKGKSKNKKNRGDSDKLALSERDLWRVWFTVRFANLACAWRPRRRAATIRQLTEMATKVPRLQSALRAQLTRCWLFALAENKPPDSKWKSLFEATMRGAGSSSSAHAESRRPSQQTNVRHRQGALGALHLRCIDRADRCARDRRSQLKRCSRARTRVIPGGLDPDEWLGRRLASFLSISDFQDELAQRLMDAPRWQLTPSWVEKKAEVLLKTSRLARAACAARPLLASLENTVQRRQRNLAPAGSRSRLFCAVLGLSPAVGDVTAKPAVSVCAPGKRRTPLPTLLHALDRIVGALQDRLGKSVELVRPGMVLERVWGQLDAAPSVGLSGRLRRAAVSLRRAVLTVIVQEYNEIQQELSGVFQHRPILEPLGQRSVELGQLVMNAAIRSLPGQSKETRAAVAMNVEELLALFFALANAPGNKATMSNSLCMEQASMFSCDGKPCVGKRLDRALERAVIPGLGSREARARISRGFCDFVSRRRSWFLVPYSAGDALLVEDRRFAFSRSITRWMRLLGPTWKEQPEGLLWLAFRKLPTGAVEEPPPWARSTNLQSAKLGCQGFEKRNKAWLPLCSSERLADRALRRGATATRAAQRERRSDGEDSAKEARRLDRHAKKAYRRALGRLWSLDRRLNDFRWLLGRRALIRIKIGIALLELHQWRKAADVAAKALRAARSGYGRSKAINICRAAVLRAIAHRLGPDPNSAKPMLTLVQGMRCWSQLIGLGDDVRVLPGVGTTTRRGLRLVRRMLR